MGPIPEPIKNSHRRRPLPGKTVAGKKPAAAAGPRIDGRWGWLVVLSFLPAFMISSGLRAEAPLILAVHPYLPAPELMERFTPLADHLAAAIDRPVEVRVGKDYEEHVAFIGRDRVDIAYLGPASFVKLLDRYGEKPILARLEIKGRPFFQGKIIVRRESSISHLPDLRGKRFAFGDPGSTMSHLVPRYLLQQAGIDAGSLGGLQFLGGHANVAMGVLMGDFDAGAVMEDVFYEFQSRGLRELATTPPISEHVFVTHNGLSPAIIDRLRRALFSLRESERGRAIMRGIKKNMTGMVPARTADYRNLRTMLDSLAKAGVYE